MKIPDKVKVGGIVYDVIITKEMPGGEDEVGHVSYRDACIMIRSSTSPDFKKVTLIHELLHAVFEQMGIEQNEETIERLAYGLSAAIEDNPEMWEADKK